MPYGTASNPRNVDGVPATVPHGTPIDGRPYIDGHWLPYAASPPPARPGAGGGRAAVRGGEGGLRNLARKMRYGTAPYRNGVCVCECVGVHPAPPLPGDLLLQLPPEALAPADIDFPSDGQVCCQTAPATSRAVTWKIDLRTLGLQCAARRAERRRPLRRGGRWRPRPRAIRAALHRPEAKLPTRAKRTRPSGPPRPSLERRACGGKVTTHGEDGENGRRAGEGGGECERGDKGKGTVPYNTGRVEGVASGGAVRYGRGEWKD